MKLSKCFQMAISNIISNRIRSLLTMLGIIIGIMSVITLVSLMSGVTNEVTSMFDEMGTTAITLNIQNRGSSRVVTADDIYSVECENPDLISGVSPTVNMMNATVRTRTNSESFTTNISGVSEIYADVTKTKIRMGRFLDYLDIDRYQNVCVIGTFIQNHMFGRTPGVGQTLKINGVPFTVVGILEEKADSTENSADECIYIPYTYVTRMNKNRNITSFTVYAKSEDTIDSAINAIKEKLAEILGDSDFYSVTSMQELRDTVTEITDMLTYALVFIAGISLLVGGIGIMNIMLVTVTERTREIGIRKALGTRRKDILNQFVIEAACLSCIGGVIGILAGSGLSLVVGKVMSMNASPSLGAIIVSFGISTAIGVGFGYLPARKAASLNPIDALRFD